MPRFRKTSVWSLRPDDVIRFRSPTDRGRGRIVALTGDVTTGFVSLTVREGSGATRQVRLTGRDTAWRQPLPLSKILLDLDAAAPTDPDRPVRGYHVKVGWEREPLWLLRHGDAYGVSEERPREPPFADRDEALEACRWLTGMHPEVATLVQPVYERVTSDRRAPQQRA